MKSREALKREREYMKKVTFETNIPHELRLQFLEGKLGASQFGGNQYMFSTDQGPFWVSETVGNILHEHLQKQRVKPGEPVEICKREVNTGNGRKSIRWELTRVGFVPGEQTDGTFVVPNSQAAATAQTGIPETDLERDLRRSIEHVQQQRAQQPQPGQPAPAPVSNGTHVSGTVGSNGNKPSGTHANAGPVAMPPQSATSSVPMPSLDGALALTKAAIDAYASAVKYATDHHGGVVSPDRVWSIFATIVIGQRQDQQKNGGRSYAA